MERDERIEQKLDKVVDHIAAIDTTLALQHASLAEHMRRTSLLEGRVDPLEKQALMIAGMVRILGLSVAAAGFIAAIIEIVMYVKA